MNRFYYIDKPLGISSFDVIRSLRKKLNTRKIGHTGTLDPLATGGVIFALGNYTKLIPYLEKSKKTYEFTVNLDGITSSFDLAEDIEFLDKSLQKKYKKELTFDKINDILIKNFTGKIKQVPPKYSALKIDGKRAYELARAGKNIEMKSRNVEIFSIEILKFSYPSLKLRATVSAGTYIRSIASDLGEILKTGGYISELRRTNISDIDVSLSQNLDSFSDSKKLFETELFRDKQFIEIDNSILEKINNGLKVKGFFNYPLGEDLFVFDGLKITNIVKFDGEYLIAVKKI